MMKTQITLKMQLDIINQQQIKDKLQECVKYVNMIFYGYVVSVNNNNNNEEEFKYFKKTTDKGYAIYTSLLCMLIKQWRWSS